MNWLMFGDGDRETLDSWEQSITDCLRKVSPDLAGVSLDLTSCDGASFAIRNNLDLTGSMKVSFRNGETQEHEIPLPYHGVFVRRGMDTENRNLAQRMVWSSWLAEKPGIRWARVANGNKELRMGLPYMQQSKMTISQKIRGSSNGHRKGYSTSSILAVTVSMASTT